MDYTIEQILLDHPGLFVGSFVVCAIVRCRENGTGPCAFGVRCEGLLRTGDGLHPLRLRWGKEAEKAADKAERTFQENRVTEDAAIGVCAAGFAVFKEGEITEVTLRGQGVDYWIDDRRAVLEVSGIRRGTADDLAKRHREKVQQLGNSSLFKMGKAGYVFVPCFSARLAVFSYHTPTR
jgi:hypothetical protein